MNAYRASTYTIPVYGVQILSRTHNMRFHNGKAGNIGRKKEARSMKSVYV